MVQFIRATVSNKKIKFNAGSMSCLLSSRFLPSYVQATLCLTLNSDRLYFFQSDRESGFNSINWQRQFYSIQFFLQKRILLTVIYIHVVVCTVRTCVHITFEQKMETIKRAMQQLQHIFSIYICIYHKRYFIQCM